MALPNFINNPAKYHADGTECWALGKKELEFIFDNVPPKSNTLETGAGLSTALLAYLKCNHTCISPAKEEHRRIKEFCVQSGISTENTTFITAFSQDVLPSLQCEPVDFLLIDGGHGFPIPFLDWLYGSQKLKVGGIVIVDDTQLWTGEILKEFLLAEHQWELVETFHTAVAFKKKSIDIIKDWGGAALCCVTEWNSTRLAIPKECCSRTSFWS